MRNPQLYVLWEFSGRASEYTWEVFKDGSSQFTHRKVEACDIVQWGDFDLKIPDYSISRDNLLGLLFNAMFDKIIRQA